MSQCFPPSWTHNCTNERGNSAQMITSALAVGSDGAVSLGAGPTFGILLAILTVHGFVCSAATNVLARLNLFYVIVNGEWYALLAKRTLIRG